MKKKTYKINYKVNGRDFDITVVGIKNAEHFIQKCIPHFENFEGATIYDESNYKVGTINPGDNN